MTVTVYHRPVRRRPPEMPSGQLKLEEPPVLAEMVGTGLMSKLPMIIMGLGMCIMIIPAIAGGGGITTMLYPLGMMMMMGSMMFFRGGGTDQRGKIRGERRDYLRYLATVRKQVREAAVEQRKALAWRHPDPESLWSVAMSGRLWERRGSHPDFAEIRIALGPQKLALTINAPKTKPIEDLEPLSARALRRFIAAYGTVADLPSAVFLRGFSQVQIRGDDAAARGAIRAVLAQLATFHSPDDLRIAVCANDEAKPEWDWVKWLPHAQHGSDQDGAGAVRLVAGEIDGLRQILLKDLENRGKFDAGASPSAEEPYVVIIVDGVALPPESRLAGAGYRNALVISTTGGETVPDGRTTLRLDISESTLDMIRTDRAGKEIRTPLGKPDSLSVARAGALARVMSPFRLPDTTAIEEPMINDFDLATLLGITDVEQFDARRTWERTDAPSSRFRVPIGVTEDGSKVELDIKEAAQGGMGPHGLLIGATGSGKSELLRTIVLSLAMTHSSEVLNFVLTDFKGGATFLGLDGLPHTSAVITNLADEQSLVERMQDALQGELNRRQELLRRAGNYSSLLEYEAARRAGTPLDPMPTLFVVVDEFSELLTTNPEFSELFVMIGRLGRSLGVHLLLASQRVDEGKMHKLESHLSYRISLKTLSAMESRSVIGVPDAYNLPAAPGNGYMRLDVQTLVRFKAAYVSGRYQRRTKEQRQEEVRRQVVVFDAARGAELVPAAPVQPAEVVAPETGPAPPGSATLLKVVADRLRGQGPPAHQVWLPPLVEPPTLDQMLPPLVPHATLGLTPASWPARGQLFVPIGLIDKPYDQIRDLYMLNLSGVGGHVAIAGGPQSGKSTLLRSIICGLALTHTPREIQFYCLDFGGGSLAALADLPHVGGIAGRMSPERVSRTVAEVAEIVATRERTFARLNIEGMPAYREAVAAGQVEDQFGDVFLVVDGWASVRADFEQVDAEIRRLAARSLAFGVHLILTTGRWLDIHSSLRDLLGNRIELRLGDSIDSMIDIRAAGKVPRIPGRGLTMDKLHYLSAVPRIDGRSKTEDLADATRSLVDAVADNWSGPPAPPVRTLPSLLPVGELPAPEGRLRVPLGLAEKDLKPVWHDFSAHPHLTVLGDTGSGKSAALRLLANAIVRGYGPDEVSIVVADTRRTLLDVVPAEYRRAMAFTPDTLREVIAPLAAELRERLPGPDISPQQLVRRDWWSGPEMFVLLDDFDLLIGSGAPGPLDPLIDLLPGAADIGLHVVLTRAAAGSMRLNMNPIIRRLQESNTPDLALSCPANEGQLLNGSRPRQLPPGRGQLVTRRTAALLQVGWLPGPADEEDRS